MTDALELLPPTGHIDGRAFTIAAIGTPLAIGIVGIPLVLPPFAAVLGLPAYIALGLPVFWLMLRFCPRIADAWPCLGFTAAGFLANLGTYPLYLFLSALQSGGLPSSAHSFGWFVFRYGLFFAPLHGLVFGLFYRWLRPTPEHLT